jgi:coproporphyrinogen III oxidase-like Fe-S oxidoreductase
MPTPRRRAPSLERERSIYAQVVKAMQYPEASMLVHQLGSARSRRYAPQELTQHWARAVAKADRASAVWNMYVHVPYCKSLCTFCNYKRLRVSSKEALNEYVAFIDNETRLFAPAFEGVQFGAIYVGGGTPSVLDPEQLDRLFGAIFGRFDFHPQAQKNFEYDPMVMTEARFDVVQRYGFTRYSFGIQSIDVDVNALHNRGRQARGHIDKQFELLNAHGANTANVDFLLGLAGTTPEQMLAEIDEVLSTHRPNEVSIYFLTPTAGYVAARFGGDFKRFEAFLAPFEEKIPPGIAELAKRIDYDVSNDGRHGLFLRNKRPHKGVPTVHAYCDIPSQVHRPLYLLGLGDSARSRIFGELHYRAEHDANDRDPESLRYVGTTTSLEDEMFAYLAFVFRDGDELSRERFRSTFGVDVLDAYTKPLDKLRSLQAIEVDENSIRFSPQSRRERLRDLLFFLPPARRKQLAASGAGKRDPLEDGVRLLRDRNWLSAEASLSRTLDQDSKRPMSWLLRAAARSKLWRRRQAREDLARVVALANGDVATLKRAQKTLNDLGLLAEAAELLCGVGAISSVMQIAAEACLKVGRYREGFSMMRGVPELNVELATALHRFGGHAEALALLHDDDAPALRFDVLVATGEHARARALLDANVAFQSVERWIALGDLDRARTFAEQMKAPTAATWLQRGELAFWASDVDEALSCVEHAQQLEPDVGLRLRGACRVWLGALDEARADLEQAEDHPETSLWRGELERRAGHPDAAETLIAEGIRKSEGYAVGGHLSRQLTVLEQRTGSGTPDRDAYAELLLLLEPIWRTPNTETPSTAGDVTAVLSRCLDAMAGNRTTRPSYVDAGGRLRPLANANGQRPLHTRFAARAIQDLLRIHDAEDVIGRLSDLAAEHSDAPIVFCHVGEVELWLGRYDDALKSFGRAIDMSPLVRWAYVGLCAAEMGRGDHPAALDWCAKGEQAFPPPGRTMFAYRGEVHRLMGAHDLALQDTQHMLSLTPRRLSSWINMALLSDDDETQRATLVRIERRAPGLVADALAEHELGGEQTLGTLFQHMLGMMRGNRSSTFVTYFTAAGELRFVPM